VENRLETQRDYEGIERAIKRMGLQELLRYKYQLFLEIEDRQIIIHAAEDELETRAMWGEMS